MAEVVVIGAGLSGTLMAYELLPQLRKGDRLTVIGQDRSIISCRRTPGSRSAGASPRKSRSISTEDHEAQGHPLRSPPAQGALHPEENRIELDDGSSVDYDYLVVATGPGAGFRRDSGPRPAATTPNRSATSTTPQTPRKPSRNSAPPPGPIVIGAVQGASCFGPAYEFVFILDTELRRRKLRDSVPMTFVTSEPYIGHLGLDGVGDTKGLLESEMRERHIKWITNARVKTVEAGVMTSRKSPKTARSAKRTSCLSPMR